MGAVGYKSLFKFIAEAVFVVDYDRKILDLNEYACLMTGFSRQELLDESLVKIIPDYDLNSPVNLSELSKREINVITRSGTRIPVELDYIPAEREGENAFFIVLKDIHEKKVSATLNEINNILTGSLNIDDVYDHLLTQVSRLIPCDGGNVMLINGNVIKFIRTKGYDRFKEELQEQINQPSITLASAQNLQKIVSSKKPLIIPDTRKEESWVHTRVSKHFNSWIGAPLIIDDHVEAIVSLDKTEPNYFTENHSVLMSLFSNQAALALKNAKLFTQEARRIQELDGLNATLTGISSNLDLDPLLNEIIQRAVVLLNASFGELGLYNPELKRIEIVVSTNPEHNPVGNFYGLGVGVMGMVAETMKPICIDDYMVFPGHQVEYEQLNLHAGLAVPLMIGKTLLGVIGIAVQDEKHKYGQHDIRLLNSFAQQATVAIQNARLYSEMQRSARQFETLYRLSQSISARIHSEEIYSEIYRAVSELMTTEFFCIALLDEKNDLIHLVYMIDNGILQPPTSQTSGEGLFSKVIKSGESILYLTMDEPTLSSSGAIVMGDDEEISQSILVVPLKIGQKTIGVVSAQSYQPNMYGDSEQEMLELLAGIVAIALDNAQLFNEVQNLAITDPLTNIYNRRKFSELAVQEFDRAARYDHSLGLIMLDFDLFKNINDTYGHIVGDQVLVALADLCRQNLRAIDILARYGGEEFVILLPETKADEALTTAERLRDNVSRAVIPTNAGELRITISLGVVIKDPTCADMEELLDRSDRALYVSKRNGRNQTTLWRPEFLPPPDESSHTKPYNRSRK